MIKEVGGWNANQNRLNLTDEPMKRQARTSKMIKDDLETFATIRVVGVGGSGGNSVSRMINAKLKGVEFIVTNTDAQALVNNPAPVKIQIGKEMTRGLGAGSNVEVGKKSVEENKEEIYEALKGSDMVFVTYGSGGGTGTGAGPTVAAIARELGALTVGIVTKPFSFEGIRRKKVAEEGIDELRDKVDTLIVIPNDRLLQVIDKKTSLTDAFTVVDDILRQGVQGISDLITLHGIINVDFADVKTIMADAGSALMGIGRGTGDNRAIEAARSAIDSPLLELSIDGAKGILFNITGGPDMSMYEIDEAAKIITEAADPDANIIFGSIVDESMSGEVKITVIATGFDEGVETRKPQKQQQPQENMNPYGGLNSYSSPVQRNYSPLIDREEEPQQNMQMREREEVAEASEDELEVPAFIRRKLK
jgi:cell division protein FtsZ